MKKTRAQTSLLDELIVDNFAGGGGASTGLELALGRPVDIAINHDPAAILMHQTNHPHTEHFQANVWDIDPRTVCRGRPVGLAWFSPDCKHFSKAKGGKPVDRNIRGLAWIALRWAGMVRPRVIILENVEDFQNDPMAAVKQVREMAASYLVLQNERNAAMNDMRSMVQSDLHCVFCVHSNKKPLDEPCYSCSGRKYWQWRGPRGCEQ